MKYPYIGKCNDDVVIFTAPSYGAMMISSDPADSIVIGRYMGVWAESRFDNRTREYLEGKCVKIESPEHSEFVQELAFNAGFEWSASGRELKHQTSKFLSFHKCGLLGHTDQPREKAADLKEITIPLPPKAESKEWPQVGDDVVICDKSNLEELFRFKGKSCKVIGVAYYEGVKVLTVVNKQQGIAAFNMGEWIKKPKTEDELLHEHVWFTVAEYLDSEDEIEPLVRDLLNYYNITKKPQ